MHIKDYKVACPQAIVVNEEALANFCSVADGIVGHREILNDLRSRLLSIDAMLTGLGAPGLILDVEGHMKGGGQFGGWSGPDGLGVATRALTSMLDQVGTAYVMRYDKDVAKKEVVHK
jgi:hypothetical protein